MTPKTNLHTHTSFTDGADTAETMVRAALERGFFSLGFSDHMPDGWWRIPTETVAEYRAEALRLKEKYFRQIEIAVGAERDFSIPLPHDGWDYLIDSVHVFRVGGESFPVDHSREDLLRTLTERFGGDGLRMAADYYGMVCRCIEERDGEIVGHLNLIEKFNDDGRFFDAEDPPLSFAGHGGRPSGRGEGQDRRDQHRRHVPRLSRRALSQPGDAHGAAPPGRPHRRHQRLPPRRVDRLRLRPGRSARPGLRL